MRCRNAEKLVREIAVTSSKIGSTSMTLTDATGERSLQKQQEQKKEQMIEAVQEMKQDIMGVDDLTDLGDMDIEFDEGWQNVSGSTFYSNREQPYQKGIVCQDSSGTVVTDQFAIAVVADGHGSAKHFHSDVGSRIAVKITTKLLKNYMNHVLILKNSFQTSRLFWPRWKNRF